MIAEPLNDHACLGKATAVIRDHMQSQAVQNFAYQLGSPQAIRGFIRALPFSPDTGIVRDGMPRIDCGLVQQRVRELPGDPNCFERAILYTAAAELLDPRSRRQLATIRVRQGLHTFPVEDGHPVVLDSFVGRNALQAGMDQMELRNAGQWDPEEVFGFVLEVARRNGSRVPKGHCRLRNAERGFTALLNQESLTRNEVDDMGLAFALAHEGAKAWTGVGVDPIRLGLLATTRLIEQHQRNRVALPLGRYRVSPDWERMGRVGAATGRVAARVGERILPTATRAYLASHGIPPQVLDDIENEYQKEGLTLGPLAAKPKPIGTLDGLALQMATGQKTGLVQMAAAGGHQPMSEFGGMNAQET